MTTVSWVAQGHLDSAPELKSIKGMAPKMLQIVRSTPMLLGAVVGHKTSLHVDANTAVGRVEPLSADDFHRLQSDMAGL